MGGKPSSAEHVFDTRQQAEQYAADFMQGLIDAPPCPRRSEPEGYAEAFCDGLEGLRPEPARSGIGEGPGWGESLGDRKLPVSPQVVALREATAAVCAVDSASLDEVQALADATAIVALTGTLKLAAVARVADVEDRKLHRIDGAPTTNSWLRQHESGLTSAEIIVARRLPRFKVCPHIGVNTGLDSLPRAPGAAPAVADSGARLPLSLVRQWWCDSVVTRFVLGLGRKVIETGHTERTLKAHERRAKRVETVGRCQVAGCRCGPGSKLIPHHPDAFANCGTTSCNDTAMLCESDHAHLHDGGTLRLRDGRLLNQNGWVQE
jgi:hypothetical protein